MQLSTTVDYATALDREAVVNQENVMVPFKHCVSAFAGYCLAAVRISGHGRRRFQAIVDGDAAGS